MKSVMTIRIDPEVHERLERMARATARTKSYLVSDAILEYLELNEWQVEAIKEGIESADRGELTPHEEVLEEWQARVSRELVVPGSRYIAAYRVRSGEVEVLRVTHGARKWPRRL